MTTQVPAKHSLLDYLIRFKIIRFAGFTGKHGSVALLVTEG